MRKASGKAEYRRIAAELEIAIRRGEYLDKLDNIDAQKRAEGTTPSVTPTPVKRVRKPRAKVVKNEESA